MRSSCHPQWKSSICVLRPVGAKHLHAASLLPRALFLVFFFQCVKCVCVDNRYLYHFHVGNTYAMESVASCKCFCFVYLGCVTLCLSHSMVMQTGVIAQVSLHVTGGLCVPRDSTYVRLNKWCGMIASYSRRMLSQTSAANLRCRSCS